MNGLEIDWLPETLREDFGDWARETQENIASAISSAVEEQPSGARVSYRELLDDADVRTAVQDSYRSFKRQLARSVNSQVRDTLGNLSPKDYENLGIGGLAVVGAAALVIAAHNRIEASTAFSEEIRGSVEAWARPEASSACDERIRSLGGAQDKGREQASSAGNGQGGRALAALPDVSPAMAAETEREAAIAAWRASMTEAAVGWSESMERPGLQPAADGEAVRPCDATRELFQSLAADGRDARACCACDERGLLYAEQVAFKLEDGSSVSALHAQYIEPWTERLQGCSDGWPDKLETIAYDTHGETVQTAVMDSREILAAYGQEALALPERALWEEGHDGLSKLLADDPERLGSELSADALARSALAGDAASFRQWEPAAADHVADRLLEDAARDPSVLSGLSPEVQAQVSEALSEHAALSAELREHPESFTTEMQEQLDAARETAVKGLMETDAAREHIETAARAQAASEGISVEEARELQTAKLEETLGQAVEERAPLTHARLEQVQQEQALEQGKGRDGQESEPGITQDAPLEAEQFTYETYQAPGEELSSELQAYMDELRAPESWEHDLLSDVLAAPEPGETSEELTYDLNYEELFGQDEETVIEETVVVETYIARPGP